MGSIYFGYPVAHEDDAQRAMYTGLGILDAIVTLNANLEVEEAQLAVRIGVHTGPVVVGEMGGGNRHENLALGETPNIAARLEGLARSNAVVISAVTARLVQDAFVLEDLGLQGLKGMAEPMAVSRLVGCRDSERQTATADSEDVSTLVGRDEEIGLLRRRWEQSKEGLGQVVLLNGEAGIGKSSLVGSLRQQVRQESGAQIVFRCSPYSTNSVLYPVIDCVRRILQLQHNDPAEHQLIKLEQEYATSNLPIGEVVPLMAALLSVPLPEGRYTELKLSPQQQRQQTLDTLVALLQEESEQRPLLVVWEDLHWADPTTLELLGLLIDQAPTAPMLHVLTYRPAFSPSWPMRSHITPLTLNHLERPQVEAMLTQLTHGKALPADVIQHIVAKTDGVPLFVEELTKMLLDSELLHEADDHFELTGPLVDVAIPDTLQDSLMARLDRLPMAREIAQFGAVLGREFPYDMLESIVPLESHVLEEGLAQLVEAELLYQRGRPPRARYVFKHALIQDAAYHALLKSRRHQLHQQVAQLLETQFPEMTEVQPELVAHHYAEAGLHEQAVVYWRQSGAQAMARSAHREAVLVFEQALADLAALPERHELLEQSIDVRLDLRNALLPLGEHERMRDHMSQAETLAETLDDAHRLGLISSNMCIYFMARGDHDQATKSGHRALDLAMNLNDYSSQAQASATLSLAYRSMGNYRQAIELARQAIELLKGDLMYESFGRLALPSVTSRFCLAICLAECGEFTDAFIFGEEAIQIAETIAHPYNLLIAYLWAGYLHHRKGEFAMAIPLLEQSLVLCQEEDIELGMPITLAFLGAAYASSGRIPEAQAMLGLIADEKSLETNIDGGLVAVWLSEVIWSTESLETSRARAEQAFAFATDRNEHGVRAWSLRLLGEIAMHEDSPGLEAAEDYYQQALTAADELGMRPLQAHCRFGLGQLYAQTWRTELAQSELAQALNLYRDMGMTYWMPQVESRLMQLERQ